MASCKHFFVPDECVWCWIQAVPESRRGDRMRLVSGIADAFRTGLRLGAERANAKSDAAIPPHGDE